MEFFYFPASPARYLSEPGFVFAGFPRSRSMFHLHKLLPRLNIKTWFYSRGFAIRRVLSAALLSGVYFACVSKF